MKILIAIVAVSLLVFGIYVGIYIIISQRYLNEDYPFKLKLTTLISVLALCVICRLIMIVAYASRLW